MVARPARGFRLDSRAPTCPAGPLGRLGLRRCVALNISSRLVCRRCVPLSAAHHAAHAGRDVPGCSLVMLALSEFEADCMAALTPLEDAGVPLGVLRYQPSDIVPPRTSSRQWLSRTTRAASRGCLGRQRAAGGCSHSGQSPRSMAARTARYCATLYPYFICMRAYVSYISFGADKGTFLHAQ